MFGQDNSLTGNTLKYKDKIEGVPGILFTDKDGEIK